MDNKLYVGNIHFDVEEKELQDLFQLAGAVTSVTIIRERQSGSSRGYGFVEMESEESAKLALEQFNGHELKGRKLKVSMALGKKPSAKSP